jgi:hypothetical protein
MTASHFQFVAGWKTPLMLFREISGAGYWGSGLLLILAVVGARTLRRDTLALLAGVVGATLAGGLAVDATFGYFIAARQFICVLPALAILAVPRRVPLLLVTALLVVCAIKDWQYFASASEDWESAASVIRSELQPSRCLMVAPAHLLRVYAALVPELSQARCPGPAHEIVLAVSPYREPGPLVLPAGYSVQSERNAGGTRVLVLSR